MELTTPIHEHLEHSSYLHRRMCPRQVLGVRLARFACTYLGIDPALQPKRLFVQVENGHCFADGIISVTRASLTNGMMKLIPYGKMAATFTDCKSGQSLHVREHPASRQTAVAMLPDATSPWAAQLQAYQDMPDELLLIWQPVEILAQLPSLPGKYSVTCARCGERVHEHRELEVGDQLLCIGCAYGTYYEVVEPADACLQEIPVALVEGR